MSTKPGKKGGVAMRRPCSETPECRHAKHGYTRRDRPTPKAKAHGEPKRR